MGKRAKEQSRAEGERRWQIGAYNYTLYIYIYTELHADHVAGGLLQKVVKYGQVDGVDGGL